MKTISFSIDLKSFFLGVLTVGGILLLANFTPDTSKQAPEPGPIRRYQVATSERETIILDTQTGQFITNTNLNWRKRSFDSADNK